MHITAVCPGCGTSYQLSPTLRGQAMRCPLPTCRTVFTVEAAPAAAAPPPPAPTAPKRNQGSGSVGDFVQILSAEAAVPAKPELPPAPPRSQTVHVSEMVPLVEAEAAEPAAPPKPADAPSWRQAAPPVRRTTNGETPPGAKSKPRPATEAETPSVLPVHDGSNGGALPEPIEVPEPTELPPGQWEPPPVRRGADAPAMEVVEAATYPDGMHPDDLAYTAARKKRRARWVMAGILLGMFFLLGGGGAVVWLVLRDTEDKLYAQATAELNEGKFNAAEGHFKELEQKFPTSGRRGEYGYLKQLSGLRVRLGTARGPAEAFEELQTFLDEHKDEPFFKQHGHYYVEGLTKKVAEFTDAPAVDETTPGTVVRAEALVAAVKVVFGDDALLKAEDDAKFAQAFAAIRKQHADWKHRAEVVKLIETLAQEPGAETLNAVKRLLKREEERLPGISQAPEVARLLDVIYDGHQASIKYVAGGEPPRGAGRDDPQPCILADAPKPLRGSGDLTEGKVVLALARGVLYALQHSDGRAVWAMRVGIDSSTPPVRVPAAAGIPALILVLSADTETLLALNEEDGGEAWRYRLSRPCLGRPVIVDRRAFLATRDGEVHEIDLFKGRPLGRYQLGQPLTHGGVRQPGTPLVYFAAADSCVYVLNVDDHKCEAILYSGHASLRSEPVIVGAGPAGEPGGWLVLNQQAQGSDAVQLRAFELPVRPRQAGEVALKKVPPLPGLTWFAPQYDGEKLALLSDAGVLGLYGVRQARNRDEPLFPLLPGSAALDLAPFLRPGTKPRGRAEVVRVQGDDFWVLALGRLQRLQRTWGGADGPRVAAVWGASLPVGSPLHASGFEPDPQSGRGTLFLTTRSLAFDDTCLATAVDDESGAVHWQRQLGMVCRGEPLLLNVPDAGGPPLVLALDQGGGLFAFDPTRFHPRPGRWERGGQHVAPPLEHSPRVAPLLLPGGDGESAFEIACPGDGKELVIRQVRAEAERLPLPDAAAGAVGSVIRHPRILVARQVRLVRERRVKLDAPVQGTPVVAGALLLVPLADGDVYRLRWKQDDQAAEGGPTWRASRAAADAQAHVVHLGGDRYLTTDGARGLQVFQWTDKRFDLLPNPEGPTLALKDRLVAPPVVLPGGAVCVADAGGVVSLLEVGGDGSLKVKREWSLGGRVPAVRLFVRRQGDAVRVGCVVLDREGRRLVWLDPDADAVCWEHQANHAIVGEPGLAEGLLVVADTGGRYTALDPRTGRAEGPGYVLRGSIAPAAAPVAFGPDRLFAPLNDGTVMVLSLDQLRNP